VIRNAAAPQPPIVADICRTIDESGVLKYRMYECGADGNVTEREYPQAGCQGTPSDVNPQPTFTEEHCGRVGTCKYVMARTPCDAVQNYKIEPIVSGICWGWSPFGDESLWINCSVLNTVYRHRDLSNTDCSAGDAAVWNFEACVSVNNNVKLLTSGGCAERYFGPTQDPTLEPTFQPTENPTFQPTINPTTMEPSSNPTTVTTAPTQPTTQPTSDPTQEPTTSQPTITTTESVVATDRSTTSMPTSNPTADADGAAHIALMANILIIMIISIFLS